MDMRSRIITASLVSCIFAGLSLTQIQSLAVEKQPIDLNDTSSIDEINKRLEVSVEHSTDPETYYFGFDVRSGPLEDSRQYLPFLDYLGRSTGYRFKLRFTPKTSSISEQLGSGEVHFAALGAVSFVLAQENYGAIILARGVNPLGKSEYQSVIVVSPESTIESTEDLRGKRFAFGSETSTQGHLIPRIMLEQFDIGLVDLETYDYTGSHASCATGVISGAFDACGMQDTMASMMASDGLVRILHTSPYYPSSGIAAGKTVPAVVNEKVRRALLDFDPKGRDRDLLYNWDRTEMPNGFQISKSEDYAELLFWLVRLEMLKEKGASIAEGRQE